MKPIILLDMDGVVTDFQSSALAAHGSSLTTDEVSQWNMAELLGISMNDFWQGIDDIDGFWQDLEPFSWMSELVNLIEGLGIEWHFCTSPSKSSYCFSGKADWMKNHFGSQFRNFVLTPQKHLLANRWNILIDDSDSNIKKFYDAGGHTVLFPQPWNLHRHLTGDRIKHVRDSLGNILQELSKSA